MPLPKIVSETKRRIEERIPPASERTRPHFWLTARSKEIYEKHLSKRFAFPLYLSKTAEEKIRNHSLHFMREDLEVMGFLLGDVYKHNGRNYSVARDVATTNLDSSSVSVKFQREGFQSLFQKLNDFPFDYVLVGWYHSHPGHGCFMSQKDLETQKKMFKEDFHSSIVIDPVKMEIEAYGLEGGDCLVRPFTVFWEEYQDPYGKVKKVKIR